MRDGLDVWNAYVQSREDQKAAVGKLRKCCRTKRGSGPHAADCQNVNQWKPAKKHGKKKHGAGANGFTDLGIPKHLNRKKNGDTVTTALLEARVTRAASNGYPKAKWIEFCEMMIERGFTVTLYEARQTFSKYVTVAGVGAAPFKLRFSNHKPIRGRELDGDCDVFVGITHTGTRTTADAIAATLRHFGFEA